LVYGDEAVIPPEVTMVSPPPPVSRYTTKQRRTSSDVMMSTSSMSKDGKQRFETHNTVKCFDAIINGSCIVGSFKWTI
jgi:hypothetical protein